jgi:hypothetical protein
MNIMSISKNNNVKRKSIRLFYSLPLFPSHLMSDYGDEHPILLVFCLAVVSLSREIVEFPLVVCLYSGIVTNYFYYSACSCFVRAWPSNWDMFRFKPVFRILFFSSLDRAHALEHLPCIVSHCYRMQSMLIPHEWLHCSIYIYILTREIFLWLVLFFVCL